MVGRLMCVGPIPPNRWPSEYPRKGTLLTPHNDPVTPREEWGAAEWRAYAEFLEDKGRSLAREHDATKARLRECEARLSRKPAVTIPHGGTLLGNAKSPVKRGRPIDPVAWRIALSAEWIRHREGITQEQAISAYYKRAKVRRGDKLDERTIMNLMSKIRKGKISPAVEESLVRMFADERDSFEKLTSNHHDK